MAYIFWVLLLQTDLVDERALEFDHFPLVLLVHELLVAFFILVSLRKVLRPLRQGNF